MKNFKLIAILIIVSILLLLIETTIFNFPFVFIYSVVALFFIKKIPMFIGIFLLDFIIDSLRVGHFGLTPIFVFATISIIFLYEKYFGSNDIVVSGLIVALAVIVYAYALSYSVFMVILFFVLMIVGYYVIPLFKSKTKFFKR